MEYLQVKGDKLKALISLFFTDSNSEKTASTLYNFEKELDVYPGHPEIRKLFRYLIKNNVLVLADQLKNMKLYYVNKKELIKIIDGQNLLKLHSKYLDEVYILFN